MATGSNSGLENMPINFRELLEEFRTVLGGRLLDAVLPPVLFLLANTLWDFQTAMLTGLGVSLLLAVLRLRRREALTYAVAGVGSVLLAMGLVWLLGRAEGFFLPGLVSGALTVGLCLLSLFFRRPLTAWSSFITRRWPLAWYWHPRVRPAYKETTLLWTVFFGLRFWWQLVLFQGGQVEKLAWVQTLSGWPALLVLLIITYLFGTWRLRSLSGPSVEEFKQQLQPPWRGQQRGF